MLHLRASSLVDTHAIAASRADLARSGDLIVLAGEMGAGKTAFAQGFGAALGVTEPITSPTYTLVHSYDAGRITLHHADIYRLTTTNEVADLALAELLEYHGIVLLEWGDVVAQSLGDHLLVQLEASLGAGRCAGSASRRRCRASSAERLTSAQLALAAATTNAAIVSTVSVSLFSTRS
jgi:tRNA threonylcarbamoyladenosine biosynthesis protein TsaE